jgi:hypothetical protein
MPNCNSLIKEVRYCFDNINHGNQNNHNNDENNIVSFLNEDTILINKEEEKKSYEKCLKKLINYLNKCDY